MFYYFYGFVVYTHTCRGERDDISFNAFLFVKVIPVRSKSLKNRLINHSIEMENVFDWTVDLTGERSFLVTLHAKNILV